MTFEKFVFLSLSIRKTNYFLAGFLTWLFEYVAILWSKDHLFLFRKMFRALSVGDDCLILSKLCVAPLRPSRLGGGGIRHLLKSRKCNCIRTASSAAAYPEGGAEEYWPPVCLAI